MVSRRLVLSVAILGAGLGCSTFLSSSGNSSNTRQSSAGQNAAVSSQPTTDQTATEQPTAMEGDVTVVAASRGPVELGAQPVKVALESTAGGTLAARVAALRPDRELILALKGIHASQPPGVLFHLYLDVPSPQIDLSLLGLSNKTGPHHIGILNFYNFVRADKSSDSDGSFSYDVTSLVKNLLSRKSLSEQTTVTIVPTVPPAPEARATIDRIELIEQ